jgi:Rieske Fe-S protein
MCSSDCPCGAKLARRDFLSRGALGALGSVLVTACGDRVIGGTYPTDPFPAKPFTIKLSDYPQLKVVGGMARVDHDPSQPVAVVRSGDAAFRAISLVCPHQGATVEITGSPAFRCPSHLAEFAADGTWSGGRETGDLTTLGVTYDSRAGTITIDGPAAAAPPPSLVVNPTTEVFSANQGGADPSPQTVAITNAGGGALAGLDAVVAYGNGQPTGWLAATFDTRTAPATLTLKPSTRTLPSGAYTATVQITAPTALNAPQTIAVSLVVTATPVATIAVSSSTVSFATVTGSSPGAQNLSVGNSGGGALSGLAVGTISYTGGSTGWLRATLSGATAPATLQLAVTSNTLAAGTYSASVPITASGASNSPAVIRVTLTVSSPTSAPSLLLSSNGLSFSGSPGSTITPQTVNVQNGGGGALGTLAVGAISYGAGASGWLSVSLSSTTAPSVLTVTATPGTLQPGTYTATIPVTSAGVANSPQNVAVTLTVIASSLVLSSTTISFSAASGTNPSGQIVNVTSSGASALSGLAYTVVYGGGASGWLSGSSLSATMTPAALTLRAASSPLAAGTYTATVQVTATGAAAVSIAVTLTVTQAGLAVVIANWPTLANVGGIAGSVGLVQGTPTAVVRTGANTFIALSMRCPHQGSTVRIENWHSTGSAFHCPNHDALFDSAGHLLPSSPQQTTNMVVRTVSYTAGATTLYIT